MSEIDDVRIEAEPIDVGEELDGAIGDMSEAVQAYTFDGDRSDAAGHHESGEPLRRGLVLGEEDPRDIDLHEIPRTEDTMWQGRIFDVNRLNVELPDGLNTWQEGVQAIREGKAEPHSKSRGFIRTLRYGIKSIGEWMLRGFKKM